MIGMRQRIAEKTQQSIADEFVNKSVIFKRDLRHADKIHVQQAVNHFRLDFVRQRAEFAHIGKHDRQFFARAAQRQRGGIFQDLIQHLFGHIRFEG